METRGVWHLLESRWNAGRSCCASRDSRQCLTRCSKSSLRRCGPPLRVGVPGAEGLNGRPGWGSALRRYGVRGTSAARDCSARALCSDTTAQRRRAAPNTATGKPSSVPSMPCAPALRAPARPAVPRLCFWNRSASRPVKGLDGSGAGRTLRTARSARRGHTPGSGLAFATWGQVLHANSPCGDAATCLANMSPVRESARARPDPELQMQDLTPSCTCKT